MFDDEIRITLPIDGETVEIWIPRRVGLPRRKEGNMDEYTNLRERLEILMSDSRIFQDKILEEVARLKVNQHKIQEKVIALEQVIVQMHLPGTRH